MKTSYVFLILLFSLVSCRGDSEHKPADIYYGEDICERCKMIISESDFAAQYISTKGMVRKFDDLGCMFHHLVDQEKLGENVFKVYVKDYVTKQWINGEKAFYVRSKDIKTPMGHGVVAFTNTDDSKKFKGDFHGNFIQIRQLITNSDN